MPGMGRRRCEFQIPLSVAGFDLILMVNDLPRLEKPAELLLHDEPVLVDVSRLPSVGMAGHLDANVALVPAPGHNLEFSRIGLPGRT